MRDLAVVNALLGNFSAPCGLVPDGSRTCKNMFCDSEVQKRTHHNHHTSTTLQIFANLCNRFAMLRHHHPYLHIDVGCADLVCAKSGANPDVFDSFFEHYQDICARNKRP